MNSKIASDFLISGAFATVPPLGQRRLAQTTRPKQYGHRFAHATGRSRLARRLTIRTKLVAGLALVVGISAVLTTSTLIGLYSFRESIRKFGAKTQELPRGSLLWDRVSQLDHPSDPAQYHKSKELDADKEPGANFDERVKNVEKALADYRARVERTMQSGRDPDEGESELPLLANIDDELALLRELPSFPYWDDDVQWLLDLAVNEQRTKDRQRFRKHVARLNTLVGKLPGPTYHDMVALAKEAKRNYATNMVIVWFTGGLVMVMLLVLTRLTYKWIFHPIRQLHRSVQRVGQVDLSHRVELNTGDEMQELAEAFNQMTARLQHVLQDLERQVEERGRQLVRSEQLASVGFLAAGVAHEINNPLASISLGSEALERRLKELISSKGTAADQVWRFLSMIQSEAFRCKGITERLLDFSRLRDQERQPCSLTNLVADVIDMVQHMGRYREKQIVLMSASDVVAEVSPQEIKQVVLNLVVNALDSMNPGGTLQIDVTEECGQATLVFTDDGCGMPPQVLRNIFEPFFTRSRTGKGTGLGLSISHRIITDHHGQMEAASDGPGTGSRFTVRLPLVCPRDKEEERCEQLAA
jgi:signal transduction histidine kinase